MVRQTPRMDVPRGIGRPFRLRLGHQPSGIGQILIDRARDDIEIQPPGPLRLIIHELAKRFRRRITQPLVDRQPVPLGLADLLRLLVQEQLVSETLRRGAAKNPANAPRQPHAIDQVLARHLVIDIQRVPAHRPVRLPLQLARPTLHRRLKRLTTIGIAPNNSACRGIARHHRHLHHNTSHRVDRQNRRVSRPPVRPERRQNNRHHLVVALKNPQQRRIEPTSRIILGRRRKLILKPKRIEKRPQPSVIVRPKTVMRSKRIRNARQRLTEIPSQHFTVRHVVRHLAQPIHVVAKCDQTRWSPRQHPKGMAHPRRARHLAKRADMRQPGRPIAGLEQRLALARSVQPGSDLGSFLERPRLRQRALVIANCCRHRRQAR